MDTISSTGSRALDKCKAVVERIRKLEHDEMTKFKEEILEKLKANINIVPPPLESRMKDLTEQQMVQIVKKMACQNCGRVPSPYARYLCPAGHIQCGFCAEKQLMVHFGKCMIEITSDKNVPKKKLYRRSAEVVPSGEVPDLWMIEYQFPLCEKKVKLHPADPIFTGIWTNITWKCPNSKGGCKEMLKGSALLDHIQECIYSNIETTKVLSKCAVKGCESQDIINNAVKHLILKHGIYAMNLGNGETNLARTGGLLYIPQSAVEVRQSYYTIVRCFKRFFLFCMEPSPSNQYDMCFWIRRISNKENKEEDNGPCFHYQLNLMNKYSALQICYKKDCTKWDKPTNDVFNDEQCLSLPTTMLLDQFVYNCVDDSDVILEGDVDEAEKGFLPVNFRIFMVNEVGDLFLTEGESTLHPSSSMESLVSEISTDSAGEGEEDFISFNVDIKNDSRLEREDFGDANMTRSSADEIEDLLDYYVRKRLREASSADMNEYYGILENGTGSSSSSSSDGTGTENGMEESDDISSNESANDKGQVQGKRLRYDTPSTSSIE